MVSESREFQPVRLRDWLTCGMCMETKSGFILILLGGLLLWFTNWKLPGLSLHAGYPVLILGVIIQAAGLGRDCKLIHKHRRKKA